MKLSDYEAAREASAREVADAVRDRITRVLAGAIARDIPLHDGVTAEARAKSRALLADGRIWLWGVECNHCSTELATDGNQLLTSPPQRPIFCVGCGWTGSTVE